ncbi:MAG: chemotaxis-specific protein-glutamate methyltransferase CheB [bacterium]|nr:chemotaxis-specific protein-glutamate methyltransferase CheB [Candidatus Sumerlaeota bacterium]
MRIAIVNDTEIALEALRRVIILSGKHKVAWAARNGLEAFDLCRKDRPDLILMDLVMPVMNGVEATRRIMQSCPTLILVVTASIDTNCGQVFEAMGAGALDAVATPNLTNAAGQQKLLAKIEIFKKLSLPEDPLPAALPPAAQKLQATEETNCLVVLGASAGGPAAVAQILAQLPAVLAAAVVIIQHVDAQFASGLASWLDSQSLMRVRLARDNEPPQTGAALVAGTKDHLVLNRSGLLSYTTEPMNLNYRPSVDVFLASALKNWTKPMIGVLLTGMGRDGARELKNLRMSGHPTIAQDRATSAVYGMPKAAAEMGAASEILPLEMIPSRIAALVNDLARRQQP